MIEELKQKLSALEAEKAELDEKLSENERQQHKLREEIYVAQTGIKIGDTVGFMDGREKAEGKVFAFEHSHSWIYVMVYLKKKDGTFGTRSKRLWTTSDDKIWKL